MREAAPAAHGGAAHARARAGAGGGGAARGGRAAAAARDRVPGLDAHLRAALLARGERTSGQIATSSSAWCRRRAWSSALEAGAIDGFCVGEPWSTRRGAARQRRRDRSREARHLAAARPRRCSRVTAAWAEANRGLHRALLRALLEAAHWCDEPGNRARARAPAREAAGSKRPNRRCCASLDRRRRPPLRALRRDLPVALARGLDRHADAALGAAREAGGRARDSRAGLSQRSLSRGGARARPPVSRRRREAGRRFTPRAGASPASAVSRWSSAPTCSSMRAASTRAIPPATSPASTSHELRVPLDELAAAQRTGS